MTALCAICADDQAGLAATRHRGARMTYLSELPHCPTCNRVLRTKEGRDWCVDCHSYVDDPVVET